MARKGTLIRSLTVLAAGAALLAAALYWIPELRGGSPDRTRITVIIKSQTQSMEFWEVLSDGVEVAAREFDVDVDIVGPDRETQIERQIELVEQALRDKPDAVVMAATDYNRLVPYAERVDAAGIPVLTVDSALNSDVTRSFIATDNMEAGRKVGMKMAELAGDRPRSKIAIISFVRGTSSQIDRELGVRAVLEDDERFEIVGTYYSDGDEEKAYETTKQLLLKHTDLTGIVGLNEPSSVGAGRAIKELGAVGRITLVGFDSSIDEVKLLEEGVMQATVVQRPFNMGYLGVKTAVEVLRGVKVPKRIDTGSVVITKDNIYEEENQKLLFPFVER
ncbi:substrate-binding domain-containing protein [uncultured Paenibacillus sp.]|uniref:substrate-binding domain-containing protein n=1 Tax=uncultured Paenibacillus sp. TaxID=227322 RepID=UPI0028D4E061|nr:substrate-binding domain-containing protein [uncultured Paenibacillus sp.]